MSQELDNLEQEVAQTETVQQSAVTLLNGLSAEVTRIKEELAQQGIDNARLNDLGTRLDTTSNALADAIVANTPAA